MPVVLVTVVGPADRADLAVPADQPVQALLDPLVRAVGHRMEGTGGLGHHAADLLAMGRVVEEPLAAGGRPEGPRAPSSRWSLGPPGGEPLPLDKSLSASGIGDGAVLVLGDGGPPGDPPRERLSAVVGVLSAAGGMGRTTVTALLAQELAQVGLGPIVAVDAHPGAGSLSERLAPGHEVTAGDLLALIDHPAMTRQELLACLAWLSPRLAVLAARSGGGRGPPLTDHDWRRLVRAVAACGFTVALDCGPGLGGPGARAALAEADQAVLVVEPRPSTAEPRDRGATGTRDRGAAGVGERGAAGTSRWVAHVLANRGLPAVAVPWPAPAGSLRAVAEALAADWTALGITATS
jgi:MinD-like ATPase involved in chromosome partitioning or flagellar assembly